MANIMYEVMKTSKDKDAILCQNYVYNYKTQNKDQSIIYVCSHLVGTQMGHFLVYQKDSISSTLFMVCLNQI